MSPTLQTSMVFSVFFEIFFEEKNRLNSGESLL